MTTPLSCVYLCVYPGHGGSAEASTLGSCQTLSELQKWAALPDPLQTYGQSAILCLKGRRGVFPGRGTDFSGQGPDRRVVFVSELNDTAD